MKWADQARILVHKREGKPMKHPIDTHELRQLETTAVTAMKRGDFINALDSYEEIDAKGWAGARHLTAQGYCLIKARRRKDAGGILLRAFNLNPDDDRCIELLDKYVPGWEKRAVETLPHPPDHRPSVPIRDTPPPAPAVTHVPRQQHRTMPRESPLLSTQHPSPQQPGGHVPEDFNNLKICWKYVLEDAKIETLG